LDEFARPRRSPDPVQVNPESLIESVTLDDFLHGVPKIRAIALEVGGLRRELAFFVVQRGFAIPHT
jgi:hypothetical protein